MTKTYSSKSNALRAAKKTLGAEVELIDGEWHVTTPATLEAGDEVAPRQIDQDRAVVEAEMRAASEAMHEEPVSFAAPDDGAAERDEAVEDAAASGTDAEDDGEGAVMEGMSLGEQPGPDRPVVACEAPQALSVTLQISVDAADAKRLATMVARYLSRTVEIVSPVVGTVEIVSPTIRAARKEPGERARRAVADATVKPIITSVANKHMQSIMDRIEAARGDLSSLEALNTFRRTQSYYKMAGRYLDALTEEARAAEQLEPVGVEVGRVAA